MYGAYLSYAQVKEYLGFMTEKGLIGKEEGTDIYRATSKGMDLLRTFEGIEEMIRVEPGPQSAKANRPSLYEW